MARYPGLPASDGTNRSHGIEKILPWNPKEATENIRNIAQSEDLTISYKLHAKERMKERGLIVSDVLYVLKNGFCYRDPLPTTRQGYHKYEMNNRTPNSNGRDVRVIAIPEMKANYLKIVTVMWVDEDDKREGTIIGEYDD